MYELIAPFNANPLESVFLVFCAVIGAIFFVTRNTPPDPAFDDDTWSTKDPHARPTPPSKRTGDHRLDSGYTDSIPAFLQKKR